MRRDDMSLPNGMKISIRLYEDSDFSSVNELNKQEGWSNLVEKQEDLRLAFESSNIKYVVCIDNRVIAYVRGLTDSFVSLYICELIVDKDYQGIGIGSRLLLFVHEKYPKTRMELLGSSSSHTYYEHHNFRNFYGFRKTYQEW